MFITADLSILQGDILDLSQRLLIDTFLETGPLNVGIHKGALTEGLLAFGVVTISLGLARKIRGNFFMETWISSDGMGLCPWGSYNQGAHTRVMACPSTGSSAGSMDI
ncbi:hypothetical protein SADUNF_Sadunf06G0018700 [Salix dunnii]|uniref:Uncharacterized protein n=1 Tax=Salix dunnii TaxID=1413687 RepID=A0A835MWI4_9ROSI|nr:hypothetical protein SADUNF_Sadunf06G0018700 [Salix dunnii]